MKEETLGDLVFMVSLGQLGRKERKGQQEIPVRGARTATRGFRDSEDRRDPRAPGDRAEKPAPREHLDLRDDLAESFLSNTFSRFAETSFDLRSLLFC